MKYVKVVGPHETATYVLLDCWNADSQNGFYVDVDPKEARELAAELLKAAKECESNLGETK